MQFKSLLLINLSLDPQKLFINTFQKILISSAREKKKKGILKQNENISLLLPGSPFTPGGPGIPSRP